MKRALVLLCLLLSGCNVSPGFSVQQELHGPDGSYDYASIEPGRDLVYVGRSFGVEAIHVRHRTTRTLLRRAGVAAVLRIPDSPWLLTTNGDLGTATLYDVRADKFLADIAAGDEPDAAAYDPYSRLAFVMDHGGKALLAIDPVAAKARWRLALAGEPEAGVADGQGKLFVNLEDRHEIAVIDVARHAQTQSYALNGCREPTGLAYDPDAKLLIVACHNNMALILDARTGMERAAVPIGRNADGAIFDARHRRAFIPCIDGTLAMFTLDASGDWRDLTTLRTRIGARTAAFDAQSERLYLPFATVERDATGKYLRARTGFGLLVVGRSQ